MNNILNIDKLKYAADKTLAKIDKNMIKFAKDFPSHSTKNGIYDIDKNLRGWTCNFWTGQLLLAYELTDDKKYLDCALNHMDSFKLRAVKKIGMNDHDIGFSFTLSTVAAYKVTGDEALREISLLAAEHLLGRFREVGGFIQLAGDRNSPVENYRLIVDCLMNIHLLYWAYDQTGYTSFFNAAKTHFYTSINNVMKPDGSSYQNVFFDPSDGRVIAKGTKQGASVDGCWSRGHSWIIYGLPLSFTHLKDNTIMDIHQKALDYYVKCLPGDLVPFWDLCYSEADGEPRDSSAAAISVCGLLEAAKVLEKDDPRCTEYKKLADDMMLSLIDNYTSFDFPEVEGILIHGSYHVKENIGVDECMSWGDYFFLEALTRYLKPDWERYW